MRIVIDLDGTICEIKKSGQSYEEVFPNKGAVERVRALKEAGHYIIIQTARHMKTCGGDQGQVVARIGKRTLEWLDKHGIAYDEVYFGKPYADVYIDDLSHKYLDWESMPTDTFNDKKVNVLIPMAGKGSRFLQAGFDMPKPLIEVKGKTMIEWAMKTFDFLHSVEEKQYIFVILKEHDEQYGLGDTLRKMFGSDSIVLTVGTVTRGQAETCLIAKELINNYNKLFIYNCDTYSVSTIWDLIEAENPDGILTCFTAEDPRYSYAKLDQYGYVCETAEKKVISNLATTGLYYFRRGADFVSTAERMVENNEQHNNEFYVAPLYNQLIKAGKRIRTVMVDENWVLGTPEELQVFNERYMSN